MVAIDLGSNSFHLLEAELDGGVLRPIARLGEKVQLGLGMDNGCLTEAAIARGLACIEHFAGYTAGRQAGRVRVVATQALRMAVNAEVFTARAEQRLGQSIEIISGRDEAELIYRGVQTEPGRPGNCAVVDVGGGSTELVLASREGIQQAVSAPVGCLSLLDCFPEGVLSESHLQLAYRRAREVFESSYRGLVIGGLPLVGCSGSLQVIEQVLQQRGAGAGIARADLDSLRLALLCFDHIETVHFEGLSESRRSVFASGLTLVQALFDTLDVEQMSLSKAALREGVAWQLLQATPIR